MILMYIYMYEKDSKKNEHLILRLKKNHQMFHHHKLNLSRRYLGSSPSGEDLVRTIRSSAFRSR